MRNRNWIIQHILVTLHWKKNYDLKLVIWLVTSPKKWWLEWTARLKSLLFTRLITTLVSTHLYTFCMQNVDIGVKNKCYIDLVYFTKKLTPKLFCIWLILMSYFFFFFWQRPIHLPWDQTSISGFHRWRLHDWSIGPNW